MLQQSRYRGNIVVRVALWKWMRELIILVWIFEEFWALLHLQYSRAYLYAEMLFVQKTELSRQLSIGDWDEPGEPTDLHRWTV